MPYSHRYWQYTTSSYSGGIELHHPVSNAFYPYGDRNRC